MRATCRAHLILLYLITQQYWVRSLSSSLCNCLHSPVTSSLLGPDIPLNIIHLNSLSLRSSLNVSDRISHPYKRIHATNGIIWLAKHASSLRSAEEFPQYFCKTAVLLSPCTAYMASSLQMTVHGGCC
jgi:hypothetical protein